MPDGSDPSLAGRERARSASRRSFLAGVGAAGLSAGLAGCSAVGGAAESESPRAVVSFFSFFDFARHVAADTSLQVENLVPTGLHGHGWEPDASVTRDIVDADAFVHVGEGFQPWADRAIEAVTDDGADTDLINAREGVELLDLAASLGDEEEVSDGKDPHFWLDPHRARRSVDNILEGFVDIVPDEEDQLRENAAAYRDELDAVDAEYRAVFADPPRDTVFLAAHNAFQYLGARYGVEIHPLVFNLAADDSVRPADITRAKALIDDHDIQYVGAAVFESLKPPRQILRETQVDAYYPVTPFAGVRESWVERGWGYTEIAREINIPTFEVVLGRATPADVGHGDWRNFEEGA